MMISSRDQGTLSGHVPLGSCGDVLTAFEKLVIVQDFIFLLVVFDVNCIAKLLLEGNLGVNSYQRESIRVHSHMMTSFL